MFISRKRYEMELENARCEGAEKVWEQVSRDREFERIHERITSLEKMINKPNTVGFETGERKC